MATREVLSPAQRSLLFGLPADLPERELAKHYTLSESDLDFICRHRGSRNRLGLSVQICLLRYPGQGLIVNQPVPVRILSYLAQQVQAKSNDFDFYLKGAKSTRSNHFREIQAHYQFQSFLENSEVQENLRNWLFSHALGTDHGLTLVSLLLSEMRTRKVIIPGVSTIEAFVWEVIHKAQLKIFRNIIQDLSEDQKSKLDYLTTLRGKNFTYLSWLKHIPQYPSPENVLEIIERLEFIRSFGLDPKLKQRIHIGRFRQLAREGSRYSTQHLHRFDPRRRYATLVAFLVETSEDLTDFSLQMHDRLMGRYMNRGERKHQEEFHKSGKAINEKVRLHWKIGRELIQAKKEGGDFVEAITKVISWQKYVQSVDEAERLARPAEFDYLDLVGNFYSNLRQYAPKLLQTFSFQAARPVRSLLDALHLLNELNRSEVKKVPENAPTDFISSKWAKYVFEKKGINRKYYELCALFELRESLRSGDLWVTGSRQFKNFDDYLISPDQWVSMKSSQQAPISSTVNLDFHSYIDSKRKLLDHQLQQFSARLISESDNEVKLKDQELKVKLLKKAVPEEAEALRMKIYSLLPKIKLTDLLLEVASWTGFPKCFTHLYNGGQCKDLFLLLTAILADGTNLGLEKMADACPGATYRKLAWIFDWYVRDETYSKALAEIVNFHHRLPYSRRWGSGTTSSSDGQAFKFGSRKDTGAQVNAKYGSDPTVMFYTHISDQFSPFYSKVIHSTHRDATHVLDGLLYHSTDLKIKEHYTDTAGYTQHVFALCSLLGFKFAPRIRNMSRKSLYTIDRPKHYPVLFPFINRTINLKRIESYWDDILRLASSVKTGTVTASLILRKLASYPKQNGLALALQELGMLEDTLFSLEWFQDPQLRRRTQVGLNKGEAANSLKRAVLFNRRGEIHDSTFEDQNYRASGLNLITAAIILWNTVYISKIVDGLQKEGIELFEQHLKHVGPLGWEHITLTGEYFWNSSQWTSLENLRPIQLRPELFESQIQENYDTAHTLH